MRVSGEGQIAVVGCMHGDERFGKRVLDQVEADATLFHGVRLILANEAAYDADKRYIDTDLNRSFNRDDISGVEADLAPQVLEAVEGSEFLIDLHTTHSVDFKALQIVAALSKNVQILLSHSEEENVALVPSSDAKHSLIGNHPAGLSLEFGREYAEGEEPLFMCLNAIRGVLRGGYGQHRHKRIYEIDRLISSDEPEFPRGLENGDFSSEHGGYVVMPKLARTSKYRGFLASKMYNLNIQEEINDHE